MPAATLRPTPHLADLLALMARLRDPDHGCPWDLAQNFQSIAPYTLEEAYEVVEAIGSGNLEHLKDELGDLLLQIVFQAQLAKEQGAFQFADVVQALMDKLIRRHPFLMEEKKEHTTAAAKATWDDIKTAEGKTKKTYYLDAVKNTQPAMHVAEALQRKASKAGFDWHAHDRVFDKIKEELDEYEQAVHAGDPAQESAEFGDMLFSLINLARHRGIDPEKALRATNQKFRQRFNFIDQALQNEGRSFADTSLEEMESLWLQAKQV